MWAALAASPLSQLRHKPEVSTGSKGELDHNNQHRVDAGQKLRRILDRGNPVKKSVNALISLSLSARALTLSVIQPIVPTVATERDRALVDLESPHLSFPAFPIAMVTLSLTVSGYLTLA